MSPSEIVEDEDAPMLRAIPRRPADAMSGSDFLRSVQGMPSVLRERAILRELRSGNIPEFLRHLRPIQLTTAHGGNVTNGTVWVMPDYLAIGSDEDYLYVPMTPITAQRVADQFGFLLPTPKIVDAVYAQGQKRLRPIELPPGPAMATTDYYRRHSDMIRSQLGVEPREGLTVGHKKDLVLTNRLRRMRRRVAIYGWHRGIGLPIQPLSTVHDDQYADYSHGVRLVGHTMLVDGVARSTPEVMQDPRAAFLVSNEGVLYQVRIATDCPGC